jgi:hypothetical protein
MLTETDVLLNFMEDTIPEFVQTATFEFPAGHWSGAKNRNQGDIFDSPLFAPPIEAKGDFRNARADFLNTKKNDSVCHYIYSASTRDEKLHEELSFWKKNEIAVAIYLTVDEKWVILTVDKRRSLVDIIRSEKILEVFGK